ncbi:MAG: cytidine deaminase [Pseudobdellovibrionaceae bacterium]
MTTSLAELHAKAVEARKNSHSPYSKHKVGAALRTSDGLVFSGCNIENASYGGTVCGERVAIWKAVSEKGSLQIQDLVVVTDQDVAWPPCGFCRQVISEFANDSTRVHLANIHGIQRSLKFGDLFPDAFQSSHLKV